MRYQVLVVEDEADTLHLLQVKLKKEGYSVTTARNGAEATAAAEAGSPDIAILDILLPDVNGLDLLADLKRQASSPIVLVLSGRSDPATIRAAFDGGADDFIPKPFSPGTLAQRIQIALIRAGKQPQAAEGS